MSRQTNSPQHDVLFYGSDTELVQQVALFVAEALHAGAGALVVATPAHRPAIDASLQRMGLPLPELAARRRYVTVDAAEVLDQFLDAGRPDPARFEAAVGGLLDSITGEHAPLHAFGEMVALLWEQGNVIGAVELEERWNDLARTRDFALLCGYPSGSLERASLTDVTRVCGEHDELRLTPPAAPEDGAKAASVVLPPATSSVPAARRFVTNTLSAWRSPLIDDAAVLVTELAANAVLHARSAFRVELQQQDTGVRIGVADASPEPPERRSARPTDRSGRGLAAVEAIATRWGWAPSRTGKTVWAELA
jgi:anti-sigma regulatory factor (Ser/Thr protein kinase)